MPKPALGQGGNAAVLVLGDLLLDFEYAVVEAEAILESVNVVLTARSLSTFGSSRDAKA